MNMFENSYISFFFLFFLLISLRFSFFSFFLFILFSLFLVFRINHLSVSVLFFIRSSSPFLNTLLHSFFTRHVNLYVSAPRSLASSASLPLPTQPLHPRRYNSMCHARFLSGISLRQKIINLYLFYAALKGNAPHLSLPG